MIVLRQPDSAPAVCGSALITCVQTCVVPPPRSAEHLVLHQGAAWFVADSQTKNNNKRNSTQTNNLIPELKYENFTEIGNIYRLLLKAKDVLLVSVSKISHTTGSFPHFDSLFIVVCLRCFSGLKP